MGIILQKFKKEKTTFELLESLEEQIKYIEDFSLSTQQRQKRFVGNFLVVSVGLYVISSIVFYFVFFPPTWSKRILYSSPLLLFPILIVLLKRLVAWFFERKINRNSVKLKTLRGEKKKILEKVMDKETYKVALEILNRFAENAPKPGYESYMSVQRTPMTPGQNAAALKAQPITPMKRNDNRPNTFQSPGVNATQVAANVQSPNLQTSQYRPTQRISSQNTPYPVVSQNQKGLVEKIVDYLIGDGPNNRYAMICKECFEHNGMVSQEEYDYAVFKCAFCKTLNPARKLRPIAPRISSQHPSHLSNVPLPQNVLTSTESSSSSESDDAPAPATIANESHVVKATDDNIAEKPIDEPFENIEEKPIEVKKDE